MMRNLRHRLVVTVLVVALVWGWLVLRRQPLQIRPKWYPRVK